MAEVIEKKVSVWDLVKSVWEKREAFPDDPVDFERNRFVFNRAFSFDLQTVFHAQEMNTLMNHLDGRLHYDYMMAEVRRNKNRFFGKWPKRRSDEDVVLIMDYYGVTAVKAAEMLRAHTKEDLKEMNEALHGGGLDDKRS